MMSVTQCLQIKEQVREMFKKGSKSNNKLYAPSYMRGREDVVLPDEFYLRISETNPEKFRKYYSRLQGKAKTDNNRIPVKDLQHAGIGISVDYAEVLNGMGDGIAGNCMEMAVSAAGLVAQSNVNKGIYIVAITRYANHSFCLISENAIPAFPNSVMEMCGYRSAVSRHWRIIDPWLNVACLASSYRLYATRKFDKWTQEVKRIHWNGAGGDSPGWYPPSGSYGEAFMTEPLEFTQFDLEGANRYK